MKKLILLISIAVILCVACNKNNNDDITPTKPSLNWELIADSASKSLVTNFWNSASNQHFFNNSSSATNNWTGNYWPQAHALDVLTDAYIRSNNAYYLGIMSQWLAGVKRGNGNKWVNNFIDDMEWIGIATFRAYKVTGNENFLTACREVWDGTTTDMNDNNAAFGIKRAWTNVGGGGLFWESRDNRHSKNACSNGPAAILATYLYNEFGDEEDLAWAKKIYAWQWQYLFNNENGAVYDNLNTTTGEINKNWIFTYNQGTFLGAALELYKITGDKAYLNDAVKAADYTLSSLTSNEILRSEGTGDGGLFKGIFVRYFTQLILSDGISNAARNRYIYFLKYNGETLWRTVTNKQKVLFGHNWATTPVESGLTEQLSGCMLMEALALLKKEGLLD